MKKIVLINIMFIVFFSLPLKCKCIDDISVNNYELIPKFNKDIFFYNIYVEDDVQIVTINASLDEYESVTSIGSQSLKKGLNTFEINLYNNDSFVDKYTLNIIRGEYIINQDNASLSRIIVDENDINLIQDNFYYKIDNYINNIILEYKIGEIGQTVIVNENDNKYIIKVISPNKSKENTYVLDFKKNIDANKNDVNMSNISDFQLKIIRIVIIFFYCIIIGLCTYFFFRKKHI